MKHLLISLLVITCGSTAFAQQAKVIKVKGSQAIVQFPAGVKPQAGQLLMIGGGDADEGSGADGDGSQGSRKHIIGGSASLEYRNSSIDSKYTTEVAFQGRYGWNLGQIEAGPLLDLSYTSKETSSTRVLGVGGFADFNLVPNDPGTEMVYGIGADASVGQSVNSTSTTETSSTLMGVFAGGFLKWFGLKTSTAVRIDAGLNYSRTAATTTTSSNTGFLVRIGLYNYF